MLYVLEAPSIVDQIAIISHIISRNVSVLNIFTDMSSTTMNERMIFIRNSKKYKIHCYILY